MALILTEGFETYATSLEISQKWTTGTITLNGTVARTGVRGAASPNMVKRVAGGSEHATFVAGFSYWTSALANADIVRFMGDTGATEHVVLRRTNTGQLAIDRGGTQLAITTDTPLPADSTHRYIEIKATLSDSVGTIDVYLNGSHVTPILTFSGDTKNGGTLTTFDTFDFTGGISTSGIDDVYLLTGSGSSPYNNLLGEVRCWPLAPTASGNSSQLLGSDGNSVSNYLLVDEVASSLNNADYVGSANVGDKDTYVYGDLTPLTGTVISVEVGSHVLKSDAGAKSFRPVVRHSGVDYGGTDVVLGLASTRSAQIYTTNPGTSAAWTISEVNAAEFGAEVRT